MIRTAELARLMHQKSDAYRIYEYNDMLKVFTELMVELMLEGEVVQLHHFGTFYPHETKPRLHYNVLKGVKEQTSGNITMKFKQARRLRDRISAIVKQERSKNEVPQNSSAVADT